jgi:hypothetical protein
MKGNFHVRFRGECGRGNPPALTRSKNNGVSYDHRSCYLFLLIVISPLDRFTQCSSCHCAICGHSHLFAPIRGDF